ncbi:hypothetical protein AAC387_Pa03g0875 [Persea americana]
MLSTGYTVNFKIPTAIWIQVLVDSVDIMATMSSGDTAGYRPGGQHPISLDLTHLWCLGLDLDPASDAYHEAPVVGDYGLGPVDQVVKLDDGAPAQGD